jgi:hypothetical protein
MSALLGEHGSTDFAGAYTYWLNGYMKGFLLHTNRRYGAYIEEMEA